jgi:hypothetical protein
MDPRMWGWAREIDTIFRTRQPVLEKVAWYEARRFVRGRPSTHKMKILLQVLAFPLRESRLGEVDPVEQGFAPREGSPR